MKFGARQCFYVCLSFCPQGGWLPSMHHRSHDQGGSASGGGVCIQGGEGGLHPGGWSDPLHPARTWKEGSTHSTGMLSCWSILLTHTQILNHTRVFTASGKIEGFLILAKS